MNIQNKINFIYGLIYEMVILIIPKHLTSRKKRKKIEKYYNILSIFLSILLLPNYIQFRIHFLVTKLLLFFQSSY